MESISRISGILENARDLTLEAARDASAARKAPTPIASSQQLKKLLESRHEREVLEALRRIISLTPSRPRPSIGTGTPLFTAVIKNISSPNPAIRKLVYIHLLQHAESEPDTALLAINAVQKTLSAPDPHARALALRVMSGIRVPVISQIVSLGIKRGTADMSPLVRRAAAQAIPKCWALDPSTAPVLTEYLSALLGDRQYYVAGAAVAAFLRVCPERLDLIHKHFRGLVRKLMDMDEWGQLATLRLMTVYARRCFPRRTKRVRVGQGPKEKSFYGDEEGQGEGETEEVQIVDPDLELLLKSALPLLQSRNSAVIVAVARCYLYLTPPNSVYLEAVIGPLVSLLRSPQDIQQIALYNIIQVALARPLPFIRYATRFLVRATDPPKIMRLKLELLTIIFPHSPSHLQSLILNELAYFCGSSSTVLVREAVRAIGRCAQSAGNDNKTSARCVRLLLAQVSSPNGDLVAEALTVIRHLIQADPSAHIPTVTRLAKSLDSMANPQARASVIWLVGEFAGVGGGNNIAPDFLRILAKGFADEAEVAKLQIVLLAAKVYVHHLNSQQKQAESEQDAPMEVGSSLPAEELGDSGGFGLSDSTAIPQETPKPSEEEDQLAVLWRYILLLARYDTSYDLRDRARVFRALLSSPSTTQLASLLLLAPKPVPQAPSPSENRRNFTLGSASLVIGAEAVGAGGFKGYEPLPEWVKEGNEPDPSLRDEPGVASATAYGERSVASASSRLEAQSGGPGVDRGVSATSNGPATVQKSLDDWLAEDEESEEDDSGESEEEEEEESEEESGEESEDDGNVNEEQKLMP